MAVMCQSTQEIFDLIEIAYLDPYYLMWKLVASLPLKRLSAAYPIPPGLLISPRKKSQKGGQQLAVSV